MTKVSVLGQSNVEKKELKKIELLFHTTGDEHETPRGGCEKAEWWDNVVLIKQNYEEGMDLIVCFNERTEGDVLCRSLMLGHWNDGVV